MTRPASFVVVLLLTGGWASPARVHRELVRPAVVIRHVSPDHPAFAVSIDVDAQVTLPPGARLEKVELLRDGVVVGVVPLRARRVPRSFSFDARTIPLHGLSLPATLTLRLRATAVGGERLESRDFRVTFAPAKSALDLGPVLGPVLPSHVWALADGSFVFCAPADHVVLVTGGVEVATAPIRGLCDGADASLAEHDGTLLFSFRRGYDEAVMGFDRSLHPLWMSRVAAGYDRDLGHLSDLLVDGYPVETSSNPAADDASVSLFDLDGRYLTGVSFSPDEPRDDYGVVGGALELLTFGEGAYYGEEWHHGDTDPPQRRLLVAPPFVVGGRSLPASVTGKLVHQGSQVLGIEQPDFGSDATAPAVLPTRARLFDWNGAEVWSTELSSSEAAVAWRDPALLWHDGRVDLIGDSGPTGDSLAVGEPDELQEVVSAPDGGDLFVTLRDDATEQARVVLVGPHLDPAVSLPWNRPGPAAFGPDGTGYFVDGATMFTLYSAAEYEALTQ